jgi:hypothetical protein
MFLEIDTFVMRASAAPDCLRFIGKDRKQTSAHALKQRLMPGDDRP